MNDSINIFPQLEYNHFQPFRFQAGWNLSDSLLINEPFKTMPPFESDHIQDIVSKLDEISTFGIGFSDVISVIAIPLIIMLFAFAFPFIFDTINHINSKYESKELSRLFELSRRYKYFWWVTYFSLAYVFIFGALYLLLPLKVIQEYGNVAAWFSLVVALAYSVCIVFFILYCVQFNKADSIIGFIERAYKADKKNVKPGRWKRIKTKFIKWRHRKDADWMKVYNQASRYSNGWGEASPDYKYNQRLIALCKFALKHHDITLLYQVLDGVDKIIAKEKHDEKRIISSKTGLTEGVPHYLSAEFFQQIFEYYATSQKDKRVEETLLWKCLYSYNKSCFLSYADVFFLSKTLRIICDKNLTTLLEKYIDRSAYYFSYIPRLPRTLYVKGFPAANRGESEKESRENWDELCNYHYLIMAYAFSKGMFSLLNVLLLNKHYREYNLYPVSPEDILIRYARCKSKIKELGYFDHMKTDELFDTMIHLDDVIEQYTMALLLLFGDKENGQTEEVTTDDLALLQNAKEKLICRANHLLKDTRLNTYLEGIKEELVVKLVDDTLNRLEKSIDPSSYFQPKKKEKEDCGITKWIRSFWPFSIFFNCDDVKAIPEKNWYKEPVDPATKEQFEACFNNYPNDIQNHLPEAFFGEDRTAKPSVIEIGECGLLINKMCFLVEDFDIHNLYREYLEILSNRIAYTLLQAYQDMKKVEVSLTPAEFGHFIDGYTSNGQDEYLIVDVNSHMSVWMDLEYRSSFRKYYKEIPLLSIEGVANFGLMTDLPAFEYFKEKLILVPKQNQPVLKDVSQDGSIRFSYNDESSEETKKLELRVGVDLCQQMTYNPKESIVVISIKKMNL